MVPKRTAVTALKPWPVTVTRVPPAPVPCAGDTAPTDGGLTNVTPSLRCLVDVPAAVWTVTSTAPAAWAGLVTSSLVDDTRWTDEPRDLPEDTVVPRAKWLPVIVTRLPPAALPLAGATAFTPGTEAATAPGAAAIAPAPRSRATATAAAVLRMTIPFRPATCRVRNGTIGRPK